VYDGETRIGNGPRLRYRSQIPIQRNQAPLRPQLRQQFTTVTTATERSVHIHAVLPHIQRSNRFIQQYRNML
jgi:hypothetical protein